MAEFKVELNYKQSGTPALKKANLSILNEELEKLGNVEITQNDGPQAGGVVDALVTFIFSDPVKPILKTIFEIYAGDILLNGSDSVVAKKLKKVFSSFSKIETNDSNWDYISITLQFENTEIVIYGWDKMFTSKISVVIASLIEQFDNLNNPKKITIPICLDKDEQDNEFYCEYRGEDFELSEYIEFWGITDQEGNKDIYNVTQKAFIHKSWD